MLWLAFIDVNVGDRKMDEQKLERIINKISNMLDYEKVPLEDGIGILVVIYINVALSVGMSQEKFDESLQYLSKAYSNVLIENFPKDIE